MGQLLFEIGCEEIPASYIRPALAFLAENITARLDENHLAHGDVKTFGTPRRLGFVLEGIPAAQEDRSEEIVGPRWDVCFKDGQATPAGIGFAKKTGVNPEDLQKVDTPKGECVRAVKKVKGCTTIEVLAGILPGMIAAIPFKKSMHWGVEPQAFTRPVHWILALFDGQVINVEFAGVKSGNKSRGHRFMAPEEFEVSEAGLFFVHLLQAYVLPFIDEREEFIRNEARRITAEKGGRVIDDEGLVAEVANLVEYPVGLPGRIPAEFMSVPKEVLILSMRTHQRYFAVLDSKGQLLPHFIFFANIISAEPETVADGNGRVLKARLADARFFVEEDRRKSLEAYCPKLEHITFQEKLGSYSDKVTRMLRQLDYLLPRIAPDLRAEAERTIKLCKADLSTQVVCEFTELQGSIGRIYANLDGEKPEIAAAIEEHYMPRGAGDDVPPSRLGLIAALADKMDSTAGCFSVGLIPSGAADPYALRRATLGILRILISHKLDFSLGDWIDAVLDTLTDKLKRDRSAVKDELLKFFAARLRAMLMEKYPTDITDGVIAVGFDMVPHVQKKVEALAAFRRNELFEPLAAAFKRVMNILKDQAAPGAIDESLLTEAAERKLYEAFSHVERNIAAALDSAEYAQALELLAALKEPVDAFFNDVMVMAEDEALRRNRLALLGKLAGLFSRIADFRVIHTDI